MADSPTVRVQGTLRYRTTAPRTQPVKNAPRSLIFPLAIYIVITQLFGPVLTVIRVSQTFNTATLLQYQNTTIVVALLLLVNRNLVRKFGVVPVVLLLSATTVGLVGLLSGTLLQSPRNGISHVVQPLVALVMYAVGRQHFFLLHRDNLRSVARLGLIGSAAGFVFGGFQLVSGRIPRFTLSASLFPIYFGLSFRKALFWILGIFLAFASAKRSTILAALVVIGFYLVTQARLAARPQWSTKLGVTLLALLISIAALQALESDSPRGDSPTSLATAGLQSSANRLASTLAAILEEDPETGALDRASAGRLTEIENASGLLSLPVILVGSGAGSTLSGTRHFIHFTPLALTVIYGLPFSLWVYGLLLHTLVSVGRRHIDRDVKVFVRLYIVGAIVSSFFGYTLFINLLTFLLIGMVHGHGRNRSRRTHQRRRRPRNQFRGRGGPNHSWPGDLRA